MVMLKASFLVVVFSMGVLAPAIARERTEQETSKEAERTTDEGR